MKAQFIFENAPWNESEDHSWVIFDIEDGSFVLRTKIQTSEEDEEEIDKEIIDPDILYRHLSRKLGLDYDELESMDMSGEFDIDNYDQKDEIVHFKTTAGDTELSLQELFNLADKTRKIRRTTQKV